jgi:hypothetical protein
MVKYLRILNILGSPSSYINLQLIPSEFPYVFEENLFLFFISVLHRLHLEGAGFDSQLPEEQFAFPLLALVVHVLHSQEFSPPTPYIALTLRLLQQIDCG